MFLDRNNRKDNHMTVPKYLRLLNYQLDMMYINSSIMHKLDNCHYIFNNHEFHNRDNLSYIYTRNFIVALNH